MRHRNKQSRTVQNITDPCLVLALTIDIGSPSRIHPCHPLSHRRFLAGLEQTTRSRPIFSGIGNSSRNMKRDTPNLNWVKKERRRIRNSKWASNCHPSLVPQGTFRLPETDFGRVQLRSTSQGPNGRGSEREGRQLRHDRPRPNPHFVREQPSGSHSPPPPLSFPPNDTHARTDTPPTMGSIC